MRSLIFDIETAPCRAAEYAQAFPKSKKKPGLHAIISQVVAIGHTDGHTPLVLAGTDEEALLRRFADDLKEHLDNGGVLVGFNIKNFDIPLLQLRAAKYGIRLDFPDRRSPRIIDIYEVLGGKWQSDISSCSLSELGWFLYGQGKATNGSDVARMWATGDIEGIRAHCLEDIKLTEKIYKDFMGVMW
jgi:DNA polymerase elongation subunit (family B)